MNGLPSFANWHLTQGTAEGQEDVIRLSSGILSSTIGINVEVYLVTVLDENSGDLAISM